MYLHQKNYEIRYTDVDFADSLKLSALMSMLEESACLSADELKFGYSELQPKSIGFVIANWYIELFRPIKLGEDLRITTWPIKPKKLIVFRDFEIYCGSEKVGVATSRWCMVDLKTFTMLPTSCIFENDWREYNDFRSVDFNSWKIPLVTDGNVAYEKSVSYSDYDHYYHLNNTKYADLLLDAFTVDELKNKYISSAQVTYVKQCKIGEKLQFFKEFSEGFWLVEGRVDGETRVQLKVKFNEI
jgi:acyl-ACP thioesterase